MPDILDQYDTVTATLLAEPIFGSCPQQDLARFIIKVEQRHVSAGEVLMEAGADAEYSYYVIDGKIDISSDNDHSVKIEKGFFGEEAAIGMDAYSARAVALENSTVLVMPREAIDFLANTREFRKNLLYSYSNRVAQSYHHIEIVQGDSKRPEKREPVRVIVGWLLAIAAPILMFVFLGGKNILPNEQALYLSAIIMVAVIMWVFRLVDDFVPAIFAILAVILFGVTPPDVALSGFGSKTFFMALSIFGLSAVIMMSGLSFRVLLILLKIGPSNRVWYNFCLFFSGAILTPIVPTTNGRVAIVSVFLTDLLGAFDKTSAKAEAPRLSASLIGGVSLLSPIFLSSKSVNFLVFGMLPVQDQANFGWLDWVVSASVVGVVMVILYAVGLAVLFRNQSRPSIPKRLIADQLSLLGPLQPAEWAGMCGLLALFFSFLTASIHNIEIPWIALAILFALLMFGFLSKSDFRGKIDWGFLIFLGALIGLVGAMEYVQLDKWLTGNIKWLSRFMEEDIALFVVALGVTLFVVRLVLPINATVVIFAALLIPTAVNFGINPWVIGFLILILAEGFIWPYQASYYFQLCSLVGKEAQADSRQVLILNASVYGIKLIAIYISFPYWRSLGIL